MWKVGLRRFRPISQNLPVILELAEGETIFEGYLAQPAVFPEEMLDVPFPGTVGKATQVHAG